MDIPEVHRDLRMRGHDAINANAMPPASGLIYDTLHGSLQMSGDYMRVRSGL